MPAPIQAGLPPYFTLDNNYIVRVTAQDPTDGSVVSGVVVSNVSLSVDPGTGTPTLPPPSPITGAYTTA